MSMLSVFAAVFVSCAPLVPPEPAPIVEDPFEALLVAVDECAADEGCFSSMTESDSLLGSCPWYEAVGCSVVVAAAVAVCVDPLTMEECEPALIAVSAIGCCNCLPSGWVRDACKAI